MAHPTATVQRSPLFPLEVAVFSGQAALQAQQLGAARVELNRPGSYAVGGLTLAVDDLARVPADLTVPVHVMIRCRSAPSDGSSDFVYSQDEMALMLRDIGRFKDAGVMDLARGDRFVFGALRWQRRVGGAVSDSDGDEIVVDEPACEAVIAAAKPFGCVFHRAFDPIAASPAAHCAHFLNRLAALGFDGLLTSAGGPGASCCDPANLAVAKRVCDVIEGRFALILGGGLRSHNAVSAIAMLRPYADSESTCTSVWLHTAAVESGPGRSTEELDVDELGKLIECISRYPTP